MEQPIEKVNRSESLPLITTSLFYLSNEAKETGMPEVSAIIINAINQIEEWVKHDYKLDLSEALMNKDTVAMLSILLKISEMPQDKLRRAFTYLQAADAEEHEAKNVIKFMRDSKH